MGWIEGAISEEEKTLWQSLIEYRPSHSCTYGGIKVFSCSFTLWICYEFSNGLNETCNTLTDVLEQEYQSRTEFFKFKMVVASIILKILLEKEILACGKPRSKQFLDDKSHCMPW